jgi:hypothetical protein
MYALLIENDCNTKSNYCKYTATTGNYYYSNTKLPDSIDQYVAYPNDKLMRLEDRLQLWISAGYTLVLQVNEPITQSYIKQNHPELLL